MSEQTKTEETLTPKWDVALENLAKHHYQTKGEPLVFADFEGLATRYKIRLDDFMITLFELVIHGSWQYQDNAGQVLQFDRDTLDQLYVQGRIKHDDLAAFDGRWQPLPEQEPAD